MSTYYSETITVNNNFQPSNPLCWAFALSAGVGESVLMFDPRKRLVHYNNRFGTLDHAKDDDLFSLNTLGRYLERTYCGIEKQISTIDRVFQTRIPTQFELTKHSGERLKGVAYPVLDGQRLGGVVVLVKSHGSALQSGGRNGE